MKKNISFEKSIEFPTMIGEISAISLEKDLQFVDESTVEGYFLLSGKYRLTEASRIEEDFSYKIPAEIHFTESLDLNSTNIEISDFSYSITNDKTMNCQIEITVEGTENNLVEEDMTDSRECDGESLTEKDVEIPVLEKSDDIVLEEKSDILEENEVDDSSMFFNIDDDKEAFGTFVVYIVRQNETINSIIEKYHTSLEEIEKYNDIKNIAIGTKLIIPLLHE